VRRNLATHPGGTASAVELFSIAAETFGLDSPVLLSRSDGSLPIPEVASTKALATTVPSIQTCFALKVIDSCILPSLDPLPDGDHVNSIPRLRATDCSYSLFPAQVLAALNCRPEGPV
jgi:hypothetical protein